MEAPSIVPIYERVFRPTFTRLGSSIRYAEEDRYLARWCAPVPGPIVDLACGTGRYTRWLIANAAKGSPVLGLDLSRAMLLRAAAQIPEACLARASAQSLPLADASVGALNCFGALHLFPDPRGAIMEVARVLRPGGSFTCLTAGRVRDERSPRGRAQAVFTPLAKFRFFEDDELSGWLDGAGFDLRDLSHHGMVVLFAATRR